MPKKIDFLLAGRKKYRKGKEIFSEKKEKGNSN